MKIYGSSDRQYAVAVIPASTPSGSRALFADDDVIVHRDAELCAMATICWVIRMSARQDRVARGAVVPNILTLS